MDVSVRGTRLRDVLRAVHGSLPDHQVGVSGEFIVNTLSDEGRMLRIALPAWRAPANPSGAAFRPARAHEPALVLDWIDSILASEYRLEHLRAERFGITPGSLFLARDGDGNRKLVRWKVATGPA